MNKAKKRALIVACVVVVFLAACVCFYLSKIGLLQYSDGQTHGDISANNVTEEDQELSDELAGLDPMQVKLSEGEIFRDDDVFNILLIGTDERTKEFNVNARGDSIMLLSLNKKEGNAKLISLERGIGVPILDGEYKGQYDWLTHTFRYGGADLVMREVQECFRVDVTHYVRVNFNTFQQGIEAIGGVDVELTQAEADYINQKLAKEGGYAPILAGENHLDGYKAITYARCRKIDSDWHRIERQRNVVQAAINKTKDLNVLELNSLLNQVLPLVQTNLTASEITNLLILAPRYQGMQMDQMTIPVKGTYGGMTGMQGRNLFAVDFDANAKILQDFIYGDSQD